MHELKKSKQGDGSSGRDRVTSHRRDDKRKTVYATRSASNSKLPALFPPGNSLNVWPNLQVGRIDDLAEREAEAVTALVMRMQDGGACCSACAAGGPCSSHAPQIEHGQAMPLRRATSGGEVLPATVRAFFEPRFGEDLSHVRIHRDADAAESARALGAKAYTLGSHIAFSAGRWAPGTDPGDRLIAHELAHATAGRDGPIKRVVDPDDGTCLRGVMSPMAIGREAHEKIQTAARAFDIDTEVGIPKMASKGMLRADLFGVWTEFEARRRGLPTIRTPENDTPWVIAEIGEIKPVSYAQGGIRHAEVGKELDGYLKYWRDFSNVPAIPMRSLRSIGPQARQHLASRMPMLLKWLQGLVISIGMIAAMVVVVALIASTAPLVTASAAAAVLLIAASGIERSHHELASL